MTKLNRYLIRFALVALVFVIACSDDSTSPVNGDIVSNAYPLALGNHWEYTLDQSVNVELDSGTVSVSAGGSQSVTVTRTENVGGDESFAMTYTHIVDYLFSEGTDTVVEHRYFAPTADGRVLLKAEEIIYNPGNNFIPFGDGDDKPVYGTLIEVDGKQEFISLETLGYLLSDPRGSFVDKRQQSGTSLASDGLINNEEAFVFTDDYVYLHQDLYEGLSWVSQEAQQAEDIKISGKVTAVLDEIDGYQGPIAVVEELNSLAAGIGVGTQFVQRFYYKSGVGLIRAEISDPDFLIIVQNNDGSAELGEGTWTFIKTLDSHSIY